MRSIALSMKLAVFRTALAGALVVAAAAHAAELPGWAIGPFERPGEGNPVIAPKPESVFDCPMRGASVHWESLHTFNPAAVVRDGQICVLYRAEDDSGEMQIGRHTSRLGLATSKDGIHFERLPTPVFYPADDDQKSAEWEGGCEDPRIVEAPDGTYVMLYTQWNQRVFRLGLATSKDLEHWEKQGPAFSDPKYADLPTKSAGIVCSLQDGRLKAVKIGGKYWMYFGEKAISLATSDDLIHWQPVVDENGKLLELITPREGYFDSELTEVGPPPVLTKDGIVVIYNGKNGENGDPAIDVGSYAAGQVLFSTDEPTKVLGRLDKPFFKPEEEFERTGQYAAGTTFTEGLVFFENRWFLYYGCADSLVGVGICDNPAVTASAEAVE